MMQTTTKKFKFRSENISERQCGGSGMFIPDPGSDFFHPGSWIRTVSIPDPGSSSKNLSILTLKKAKKWFLSSKSMIRVVHPGSRIRMLTFSHHGSRGQKGTQSRIPDPDPQHCWKGRFLILRTEFRIRDIWDCSCSFRQWLSRCQQKVSTKLSLLMSYNFLQLHLQQS